jgi:hypothetical protein
VTDVGALSNDWVTDPALLERVLARLRQWEPGPRHRRTPGAPQFGATCRRARPGDPPADITMPRSPDRPPVACPPPLFRRLVGPTTPPSESGPSHG